MLSFTSIESSCGFVLIRFQIQRQNVEPIHMHKLQCQPLEFLNLMQPLQRFLFFFSNSIPPVVFPISVSVACFSSYKPEEIQSHTTVRMVVLKAKLNKTSFILIALPWFSTAVRVKSKFLNTVQKSLDKVNFALSSLATLPLTYYVLATLVFFQYLNKPSSFFT